MQNETQESKDGLRSFIVLMDKNKDTQWLEDGKFVGNPLVFQKPKQAIGIHEAIAVLTGLEYVSDYTATHDGSYAIYNVDGMCRNGALLQQRRTQVVIKYK